MQPKTLPAKRRLAVPIVTAAAFLAPFTQSIYIPILPELSHVFQTTNFWINASISIYTAMLAIMQLVYGPIGDRKGRKRVLLFGLFLYTVSSIGCYFSVSIEMFLLFRALQGFGIAAASVMAVTVIGDLLEGPQRLKAMGWYQSALSLGPVAGPLLGGVIAGHMHYSIIFAVTIACGLLALAATFFNLPETRPEAAVRAFSLHDFSRILRNRIGSSMILLGVVQYFTLYNFIIYLPVVLTVRYELSIEQKGLAFVPLTLAIMAGSMIGARLSGRMRSKTYLLLCGIFGIISLILFLLTAEYTLALLIITAAMYGLALGISLPAQTDLLTKEFAAVRATAVGVYNFFRFVGMTLGPVIGSALGAYGVQMQFGFAAFAAGLILLYLYRRL